MSLLSALFAGMFFTYSVYLLVLVITDVDIRGATGINHVRVFISGISLGMFMWLVVR